MEEEDTRDYNEPCPQCSEVNWGLTEEGAFYCRSCHNVIERTRDVLAADATTNARAHSISKGLKKKTKSDKGWEWYICEGFQYILQKQAEALQSLGVSSQIKDEVLWNLWKNYLQKSIQPCDRLRSDATSNALPLSSDTDGEVNSEPDIVRLLGLSESDTDLLSDSSIGETSSVTSEISNWSGSVDGSLYFWKKKKGDVRMSMPMTLAFCYMALLWLRESITLSDLLRLVMDGHIPYMNAYQDFPEEIKVYGTDFKIFHVESWPVYEDIHKKMQSLATFLELPRFPDIAEDSFFHPNILCLKYLMEANLPDDMHKWTCRVVKEIDIGEVDFLTLQPENKSVRKVKYDILAVAVVIVVLKLFFLLNDDYEWQVSNYVEERNKNKRGRPVFDIRKWYVVVKKTMDVEQKKLEEERVRYLWRSKQPLYFLPHKKSVVLKKRQMVTVLQRQFRSLSDTVEHTEKKKPSSFQMHWTEDDPERPCFHGHSLNGILQQEGHVLTIHSTDYWLCTTKLCKERECGHLAHYNESDFPHTYQFVLSLFSFILRVKPSLVHEEVCAIEHRLFYSKVRERPRIPQEKKAESLKDRRLEQQCEDLHAVSSTAHAVELVLPGNTTESRGWD